MLALFASVVAGIVPAKEAFLGFGDDVVIIVATALLASKAVAKSGVMESLLRPLAPYLTSTRAQRWVPVAILAAAVATIVLEWLPIAVAFFGAGLALMLTRSLTLREAYESIEWPITKASATAAPASTSTANPKAARKARAL